MPEETIRIFTDGSGAVDDLCVGSYAACVTLPASVAEVVKPRFKIGDRIGIVTAGAVAPTKLGRMELSAVIAGLNLLRHQSLNLERFVIEVFSDSEYVVKCCLGQYGRNKNLDLWAQFNEAAKGVDIKIRHVGRNTEPEQAMADAICDWLRRSVMDSLGDLYNTEEFKKVEFKR